MKSALQLAKLPHILTAQSLPQLRCRFPVALQAQRPDIGQIAFTATFSNRRDVVGIPQARSPQILQAQVAERA